MRELAPLIYDIEVANLYPCENKPTLGVHFILGGVFSLRLYSQYVLVHGYLSYRLNCDYAVHL